MDGLDGSQHWVIWLIGFQAVGWQSPVVPQVLPVPDVVRSSTANKTDYQLWPVSSYPKGGWTGLLVTLASVVIQVKLLEDPVYRHPTRHLSGIEVAREEFPNNDLFTLEGPMYRSDMDKHSYEYFFLSDFMDIMEEENHPIPFTWSIFHDNLGLDIREFAVDRCGGC